MGTGHEIGLEFDRPGEECGVVGFWFNDAGHEAIKNGEIDPFKMMYDALCSQSNRGQQNTGIWTDTGLIDDGELSRSVIRPGKPQRAFKKSELLSLFAPNPRYLLGHNRYTTIGGDSGGQPIEFDDLAIVHNGQFNAFPESELPLDHQPSDSWRWGALVADDIDDGFTAAGAMIKNARLSEGTYSIIAQHDKKMVMMRDPFGNRPLMRSPMMLSGVHIGWFGASESPTLLAAGVDPYGQIKKVKPGELIVFGESGRERINYAEPKPAYCAMEHAYLSKPDHGTEKVWLSSSNMGEVRAHRYQMGIILSEQHPVEFDENGEKPVVVPILGSAEMSAQGFADNLDLHVEHWITKLDENDRNFMRLAGSRAGGDYEVFWDPINEENVVVIDNHKIYIDRMNSQVLVLVDDSVVRGDTMKKIVGAISHFGKPHSVHIRITSPAIVKACTFGTDYQDEEQLFTHNVTRQEFCEENMISSFEHIDLEGMQVACGKDPKSDDWLWGEKICDHCFGGDNSPSASKVNFIQKPISV